MPAHFRKTNVDYLVEIMLGMKSAEKVSSHIGGPLSGEARDAIARMDKAMQDTLTAAAEAITALGGPLVATPVAMSPAPAAPRMHRVPAGNDEAEAARQEDLAAAAHDAQDAEQETQSRLTAGGS